MSIELDMKAIKELYTDPMHIAVWDDLAGQSGSPPTLELNHALRAVVKYMGKPCTRGELVSFFRKLEFYGAGTLISGHEKFPTEFRWSTGAVILARIVTGEKADVTA